MPHTIAARVAEWSRNVQDADLAFVHELVTFFAEKRFREYQPTRGGPHSEFLNRLRDWLNGAPDETVQKVMLRTVPHLLFIGESEFLALYRDAYRRIAQQWIFDQIGLSYDEPDASKLLRAAIDETWFCPITDSLNINAFCHVNQIAGPPIRPTWDSLVELGRSRDDIVAYMATNNLRRLVLLEDFVGSGSQIAPAVQAAAALGLPVLIIPLVLCPEGAEAAIKWEAQHIWMTVRPCFALRPEHFVAPTPSTDEVAFFGTLRRTIVQVEHIVRGDNLEKYYGPFGYRHTGGLIVLFSNTPDNSIPLIHWRSSTWAPLFPRAARGV